MLDDGTFGTPRGTAPDQSTAERLLDAAQRLFVAYGSVEAVSARAITREAGVNSAALHYHFGSREGLLQELIVGRTTELRDARAPLIRRLELQEQVTAREIAEAWARPLIDSVLDAESAGLYWVRLAARGAVWNDARARHVATEVFEPERQRLAGLLERAAPSVDPRVRAFRLWLMIATAFRALASIDDERSGGPALLPDEYGEELIAALAALLIPDAESLSER